MSPRSCRGCPVASPPRRRPASPLPRLADSPTRRLADLPTRRLAVSPTHCLAAGSQALITPVLLRRLDKQYPHLEFCFMAGADLLEGMQYWGGDDEELKGWEKTRQMVVLPREGYDIPEDWNRRSNVRMVSIPGGMVTSNHSSSNLRKRVGPGKARGEGGRLSGLEGLTAKSVISHIGRNSLYTHV